MAWMGLTKKDLELSGPISGVSLSSVAEWTFCSKCGSNLTLQYECYPEKTHLAVTTVTKTEIVVPRVGVHIFVKSCPNWYEIPNDGVERYDEFDTDFGQRFPEVVRALKKL